ncbi:hypothetical protein ACFLUZ_00245 [Chloroflexota bacterium]
MSKVVKMVTMALILTVILTLAVAGAAFADNPDSPKLGPAPNSGDGVPDGPGWPDDTIPYGPIGSGSESMGPAGSCFRDGSCQE